MYLRPFRPSTSRFDDCGLAAAVGVLLGIYASFFFGLYWLMQPSVSPNTGLAGYRPPPKTVVRYADAPWVPPPPSEALPIRVVDEPALIEVASSNVTEEPKRETKKETKKHPARTSPRRARPVREQRNPFSGYALSRSFGSRPWF